MSKNENTMKLRISLMALPGSVKADLVFPRTPIFDEIKTDELIWARERMGRRGENHKDGVEACINFLCCELRMSCYSYHHL